LLVKWGYELYYGDTDSVFPILKHQNVENGSAELLGLVEKLNASYSALKPIFNVDQHYFQEKAEKIYRRFFMVLKKGTKKVAKKRYAGNIVWEGEPCDELDIKGFDRSDMSRVGNTITKTVLKMACYDKTTKEISDYVKCEVTKFRNKENPLTEIAFSKGIKKNIVEYAGKKDWIRAAEWTNAHSALWNGQTNFGLNSKPKYIYLLPNKIPAPYEKTNMIALDDNYFIPDELVKAIDYETLIDKTIRLKVESALDALGLNWDKLSSNTHIKSLKGYTGVKT